MFVALGRGLKPRWGLEVSIAASRRTSHPFHASPASPAKNRIYNSVRNQEDFSSILLLSATNRIPLITLFTASWCPSCRVIAPLVKELVDEGVGETQGSVSYAEIEIDSPDIGDITHQYTITSLPTLMAFSRQEAQMETRTSSVNEMKDREFLTRWIEKEAARAGDGGAGGGLSSFLGGWLGR